MVGRGPAPPRAESRRSSASFGSTADRGFATLLGIYEFDGVGCGERTLHVLRIELRWLGDLRGETAPALESNRVIWLSLP